MTVQGREQGALQAYLRLLQNKGTAPEVLAHRKALLIGLMELLRGQQMDGALYRECVERAMPALEKRMWPAFLAAAREYYYFWTQDIKSIAAMHANGGYDGVRLDSFVPEENLRVVWEGLDREKFEVAETWPLKAYAAALRDEGADKSVVETRCKLVKLLLVRLRGNDDKSAVCYRRAVDATVTLFSMKETRQLFLIVVREFFYFWIGDPEASRRILLDIQRTDA